MIESGYIAGIDPLPNNDGAKDATNEGRVRVVMDDNGRVRKEVYLRNHSTTSAISGAPYIYMIKGVAGSGFCAIDPAAVATVNREVVFATTNTAANQFGWYAFSGIMQVAVSGSVSVSAGGWLKLAPGDTPVALVLDHATTRSNSSVAMARAAGPSVGSSANNVSQVEALMLADRVVVNV